jgi:ADP-dependent NAD(P)H-hydrate dehydratase / NAD(P)H-hydrate epimerase
MKFITKRDLVIPKKRGTKKGDNGKVLIIGGSEDYAGALTLAGMAALRAGVDWVTVACPERVGWAVNALSPDLVVKKFPGKNFNRSHAKKLLALEKEFDAVLIGNGIGMQASTLVKIFVRCSIKPLVVDADGIKAIALQDVKNGILTPHKGEFEQLLENSNLILSKFEKQLGGNVVVVTGAVDTIYAQGRRVFNKTGNPGMTKAGTGDVLAGLCLGFLGQGLTLFQSAVNGAYINGALGDLLQKKNGFSYIASDLLMDLRKIL